MEAIYPALWDVTGLKPGNVLLPVTSQNRHFNVPRRLRNPAEPSCIRQKQLVYPTQRESDDASPDLSVSATPGFDHRMFIDSNYSVDKIEYLKRRVNWNVPARVQHCFPLTTCAGDQDVRR